MPESRFLASTTIIDAVAPRDGVALSRTRLILPYDDSLVAERLQLSHLRVHRPGAHD
jgi:hypothetical protein